jgi:hypothetical protein
MIFIRGRHGEPVPDGDGHITPEAAGRGEDKQAAVRPGAHSSRIIRALSRACAGRDHGLLLALQVKGKQRKRGEILVRSSLSVPPASLRSRRLPVSFLSWRIASPVFRDPGPAILVFLTS